MEPGGSPAREAFGPRRRRANVVQSFAGKPSVHDDLRLLALLTCRPVVGSGRSRSKPRRIAGGFFEQRFDVVELAAGTEPLQPPLEVSPPADRSLEGRAGEVSELNQRGDSTHDPCDVAD
jgi:hypothetical protein